MNQFHFYIPAFCDVERPASIEFSALEELYECPEVKKFAEPKAKLTEVEDLVTGRLEKINRPGFVKFDNDGVCLTAEYSDGSRLVVGFFENPIGR